MQIDLIRPRLGQHGPGAFIYSIMYYGISSVIQYIIIIICTRHGYISFFLLSVSMSKRPKADWGIFYPVYFPPSAISVNIGKEV